jgi:hypothetical protein
MAATILVLVVEDILCPKCQGVNFATVILYHGRVCELVWGGGKVDASLRQDTKVREYFPAHTATPGLNPTILRLVVLFLKSEA